MCVWRWSVRNIVSVIGRAGDGDRSPRVTARQAAHCRGAARGRPLVSLSMSRTSPGVSSWSRAASGSGSDSDSCAAWCPATIPEITGVSSLCFSLLSLLGERRREQGRAGQGRAGG